MTSVVKTRKVGLIVKPEAVLMLGDTAADITPAVSAEIDRTLTSVAVPPPVAWQPKAQGQQGQAPAAGAPAPAAPAPAAPRQRPRGRRAGDRRGDDGIAGPARYRAGHGGAPPSLPDAAGRPRRGTDPRPVDHGDQGGDDQRGLLPGAFPRSPDHARRADRRGDGAGRRYPGGRIARPRGLGKLVYFMSIDEVKFRKPVEPGVLLRLEVEIVQKKRPRHQVRGARDGRRQARRRGEVHGDDHGSAQGLTSPQVALTGRLC